MRWGGIKLSFEALAWPNYVNFTLSNCLSTLCKRECKALQDVGSKKFSVDGAHWKSIKCGVKWVEMTWELSHWLLLKYRHSQRETALQSEALWCFLLYFLPIYFTFSFFFSFKAFLAESCNICRPHSAWSPGLHSEPSGKKKKTNKLIFVFMCFKYLLVSNRIKK